MFRIVMAGILAGLVVFAWGAVSWMVLPIHDGTMRRFVDDDEVASALRRNAPTPGWYPLPVPPEEFDPASDSPEHVRFRDRHRAGPVGTLFLNPGGEEMMPPSMFAGGLAIDVAAGVIAAALLSMATAAGLGVFTRIGFVVLLGCFAAVTTHVSNWNWMRFPADWTLAVAADTVIGWALAGLVLSLFFWPPGEPIPPIRADQRKA